jgi:nucleoside-diphosphate-sugar epimerase
MNVSIIGTNGFLSNCIGQYCNSQQYNLYAYGRTVPTFHSYSEFINVNLLNDTLDYEKLAESDVIIYAAGGGIQFGLKENVDAIYQLNVLTPVSIFNSLSEKKYKGKFITFGSYFEIGENIENISFDENEIFSSLLVAPNDYSISKRLLTRFFNSVPNKCSFYHFILPTIYGETESKNRLIPYVLNSIHNNINIGLTSGDQVRQYIYIYDAIKIIFTVIEKNLASGILNIPCVEAFSVRDLVTLLFELNKKALPSDIFGRTERADVGMKILKLNAQKLLNQIDYVPATSISDVYKKYKFD